MNKLSKLTALLLAIVLALGVPMQVMAEGEEIETKTKYYEVADMILQKMIMAYETYGEYKSMAELIAEEDFVSFYEGLSEEDQAAMADYINRKFWASCIAYTKVAPFSTVNSETIQPATTFSLIEREATELAEGDTTGETTSDGLFLSKNATGPDSDGFYTITLDAYVTGNVTITTTTEVKPMDIVLVLDVSGSMAYDFSGISRLAAVKNAVYNFISSIQKNSGDKHRISIISYAGTEGGDYGHVTLEHGWTYVTAENAVAMQTTVNNLEAEGATYTDVAMDMALEQLTDNYTIPEGSGERQKVVILFTDGVPGTSESNIHPERIESVIDTANTMKGATIGATVYTVAIYSNAAPSTTPETVPDNNVERINAMMHAASSNYPTASAEYPVTVQVPVEKQVNQLCIHVSDPYSRTPACTEGCQWNWIYQSEWRQAWCYSETQTTTETRNNQLQITYNTLNPNAAPFTGGDSYYLTASSADTLNNIFQQISNNIQTGGTTSTLTQTTVVKDVMSDYFVLPEGFDASSVTIQTALYNGASADPQWTVEDTLPFTPEIEFGVDEATGNDYVTVKNFDYAANFVSETGRDPSDPNKEGTFKGRKLIISFKVEPTDGFLGGNGVVTNDPSSGIYQPSTDGTTLEPVKPFPEPDVNVEFKAIEINGLNQYIYLSNYADLNKLLNSFTIKYKFAVNGKEYQVDGYRNGYAALRFKLMDPQSDPDNPTYIYFTIYPGEETGVWTYVDNGAVVPDTVGQEILRYLTEDTKYEISFEVFAKEDVDEKNKVIPLTATPQKTGTLDAWVYVFKPEVTFQDSKYQYMKPVDADVAGDHYNSVNWLGDTQVLWTNSKFTQDLDHLTGVMASGPRPTLTFEYTPALDTWIDTNDNVYATACVPVDVTKVTATSDHGTMDVTGHTTSYRNEIGCDCTHDALTNGKTNVQSTEVPEFVIHVFDVMGNLTISKTVTGDGASADDTFLFTITGPGITGQMQVILKGGESVTINNLLVGDYVVKEETGWSWRYACEELDATLEAKVEGNKTATVKFTNELKTPTWLDGNAHADNDFTGITTTTEGGGN